MNGRTIFVVSWMAFLFVLSWVIAMGRLIGIHFWDRKSALAHLQKQSGDPTLYNSTAFEDVGISYFTYRYIYFLPHVIGAIIWWNFYFIQLIPSIRKTYKSFHRWMGRILMVTSTVQAITGFGLAALSLSATIKSVSFVYGISILYCVYRAWTAAIAKDIPKHKHWVLRLVGYSQTIALQRFFFILLLVLHQMGFYFMFPSVEGSSMEEINRVVMGIFDQGFVLAVLTSYLFTEWYLDAQDGWMEAPAATIVNPSTSEPAAEEKKLLYSSVP